MSVEAHTGGRIGEAVALIVVVSLILFVVLFDVLVHGASALTGGPELSWHPATVVFTLLSGETVLSVSTWIVLGVLVGLLAGLVVFGWWFFRRRGRSGSKRGDKAAKLTGKRGDSASVRAKAVGAKARNLYGDSDEAQRLAGEYPGYVLGRDVANRDILMGDWESVGLYIAGPRSGKTAAIATPIIIEAPGAVLATSNKRDLVDLTRGVREKRGSVFVFDPCEITKGAPEIFWNPLSYIRAEGGYDGSMVARASRLSKVMGDAGRATDTTGKRDAFFDDGGDQLRANMLLAAALEPNGTLEDAFTWLNDESEYKPVEILRAHGFTASATALEGKMNLPSDTKGGVFACARMGLDFIEDPAMQAWYTPGINADGHVRREFDPTIFARSTDTLYSMSKDDGSITPLVAALTAVVCYAAEYAAEANGGRLEIPMCLVLDEAANVCPWSELPSLYSHCGSKGLVLLTILQSWSQGKGVWGDIGMNKLWSAANITMYMGGSNEVEFLKNLSALIGERHINQESTSVTRGQRTYSTTKSAQRVPIASVEDLRALPEWRGWLLASKSRPVLVELMPWFKGKRKGEIVDSLQRFGAKKTSDTQFQLANEMEEELVEA